MQTADAAPQVNDDRVDRLLAAARETISAVHYCWVATRSHDGGTNARAVRMFAAAPGNDEWTRRFLSRRGSRKVTEIRQAPRITLGYQHASGDVYVTLVGHAAVVDDRSEMRSLWQPSWDDLFPAGFADANMIVVKVEVDRIEIHARGITAEPFGHGRTLIERDVKAGWRLTTE